MFCHTWDRSIILPECRSTIGSYVFPFLLAGAGEDGKLLMTAKMNFLASAVTDHVNLVNLVAAIPQGMVPPFINCLL